MKNDNPLKNWRVERSTIRILGKDLHRPECILAERDGSIWCSDARGGVTKINSDGSQQLLAAPNTATTPEHDIAAATMPNGLAFDQSGDVVIANFGTGAIELLQRDGTFKTLYTEIDGKPLGKVNFVLRDSKNRLWFSVLTQLDPWTRSINEKPTDGYVGLIDTSGIHVVAEGFNGTNEIRFDAKEEWLYVVESHARHITRVRFTPDGKEIEREVFGPLDLGGTPDGCAFDAYGNLWITLVMTDCLIALTPEGELVTLLDDRDPKQSAIYNDAFYNNAMTPEIIGATKGTIAPWMASITFGGPDLCTVYLGSLLGTKIPYFRSPVPGLPRIHWNESY